MKIYCYKCSLVGFEVQTRSDFKHHGSYYRTSDKKYIKRYFCNRCRGTFSRSFFDAFYRQKKRHLNPLIEAHLSSTESQRRLAKILNVDRKTIARKFRQMAELAESHFYERNANLPLAEVIEFDDLETFEHTKCKPLSVTLAVEHKTRRILGVEVSRMPANGLLAKKAQKYGPRTDERRSGRRRLFQKIQNLVDPFVEIKSDHNPHYVNDVKEFFPKAEHKRYLGRKPKAYGQGELKEGGFDPLFSINHTFAKMRADINRLIRKTWCTTKNSSDLYRHLILFANYHNKNLPPSQQQPKGPV